MESMSTETLAARFFDRTLPKSEWTHAAHLRVGVAVVLVDGPEIALSRLRAAISGYNTSVGCENSDSSGYHETITRFYVATIARFLESVDRTRSLDDLADEVVERFGDRELPLRYWSRDLLFSVEARRGWVEPDLRSLPLGSADALNDAESGVETRSRGSVDHSGTSRSSLDEGLESRPE
jgi:hypothetical protein